MIEKSLIKEVIKEMFKSGEIQIVAEQHWLDKDIMVKIQIDGEIVVKKHSLTAPCGSHKSCIGCGTLNICSYND